MATKPLVNVKISFNNKTLKQHMAACKKVLRPSGKKKKGDLFLVGSEEDPILVRLMEATEEGDFWVTLSAAKSGVGFVTKFVFVVGSVIPVFFPVPSVDACCANVPHARNVWRWMAVKSSTLNQLI